MPTNNTELQDAVLSMSSIINDKIMALRLAGSSTFGTSQFKSNEKDMDVNISNGFITLCNNIESAVKKGDTDIIHLYSSLFGKGSRFRDWLGRQDFDSIEKISEKYFDTRKLINQANQLELENPRDPVQELINTETNHLNRLALAMPFLNRMINSENISKPQKDIIRNFYNEFVQVRQQLSDLNQGLTPENVLQHLQSDAYFEAQTALFNLEDRYGREIKGLLTTLPKKFHWHLGESLSTGTEVLDNLYLTQRNKIYELIKQIPHSAEALQLHQRHNDRMDGTKMTRHFILSQPKNKRQDIALRLLANLDTDLPLMPEAIRDNPFLRLGCINELSVILQENKRIHLVLKAIQPIEDIGVNEKITAYKNLIVSLSDKNAATQFAEKLLFIAYSHNVMADNSDLKAVYKTIKPSWIGSMIKSEPYYLTEKETHHVYNKLDDFFSSVKHRDAGIPEFEQRLQNACALDIALFHSIPEYLTKEPISEQFSEEEGASETKKEESVQEFKDQINAFRNEGNPPEPGNNLNP